MYNKMDGYLFLALIFSWLENIFKISENKFGLYCFCIHICITIIK